MSDVLSADHCKILLKLRFYLVGKYLKVVCIGFGRFVGVVFDQNNSPFSMSVSVGE